MLRKKSASDFPKADFSIWLSGTPVILTGRLDKTVSSGRPLRKRLMGLIWAVVIQVGLERQSEVFFDRLLDTILRREEMFWSK